MKSYTLGTLFILGALLSTGCMAEIADENVVDAENTAEAEDGLWVIDTSSTYKLWDSGLTNNLSSWQSATCAATYGDYYLLTQLKAWREPTSNLDNFIARLQARCSEYEESAPGQTWSVLTMSGTHVNELVYSGNYDSSRSGITVLQNNTNLPLGVKISKNAGNDYVKDVTLIYGNTYTTPQGTKYISGYASQYISGWALDNGLHDYVTTLLCPEQSVAAGIAVRYDTTNGKIRQLKIYCRAVANI